LEHSLVKSQEVGAETGAVEIVLDQGRAVVIGKVRLDVNGRKLLKLPSLPGLLKPLNHVTSLDHGLVKKESVLQLLPLVLVVLIS